MKRRDLVKLLESNGWYYVRDGGRHDIYSNGKIPSRYQDTVKSTNYLRNPSLESMDSNSPYFLPSANEFYWRYYNEKCISCGFNTV